MAATAHVAVSPQARLTYLAISAIIRGQRRPLVSSSCCPSTHTRSRKHLSTNRRRRDSGAYFRSDFANQGFTGEYIPNEQTTGPLKDASSTGAPRITPKLLKDHLDQFVVGQDRAKKALATAVYNHYQRIQELQRRDEEEEDRIAQEERRRMSELRRHPVEGRESELKRGIAVPSLTAEWPQDEWPGQQPTIHMPAPGSSGAQQNVDYRPLGGQQRHQRSQNGSGPPPLVDDSPLTIEKSNILLLGPSGVGKTLMAKTLARVLEVPFSMSDCTPFTQAGYIGEDAEVCVQRLLAAANYDVTRAERGIICLDEIDKIATAKVSHGKDVSGEGVQQALLKIIEGTTLQIQAKQERGSSTGSAGAGGSGRGQGGYPTNSPLSGGTMSGGGQQNPSSGGAQKGETYNVKTDNILFICAGAFNGLHKQILDRVSKGSIGFGATVRARPGSSEDSNVHETIVEGEDELFEKHLPYYAPDESTRPTTDGQKKKRTFNTLDLVEPQDLQKYGLIPELVGRIPLSCALSSLDIESLVKVLTEPRNSLLQQYKQLFALSSIELRITSPALRSIASTAAKMGTGARGLRTVMERLLADAMFETPGSGVKYVLITEDAAERKANAMYFYRGDLGRFQQVAAAEEEAWEEKLRRAEGDGESEWERRGRVNSEGGAATTFEEYRQKATAAGFV
ncbi:ATP-dependent Clp protease ATP-binding subunit ClpX [Teratosphaeria destructans]|uniref:ATP-dependent Clp protease ATP-binding subunit ClpX n=1 Tax=Teratosphaeria destructans TaxID=418781 RepID=A0A9W7T071_9PEZI|nr:ATP-dependent Clp protease ATP-binding subunit ClpX [Teratosphaeria destructans]